MGFGQWKWAVAIVGIWCWGMLGRLGRVNGETDPNDMEILNAFKKGLKNAKLLEWPEGGTDPCGQKWKHVFCTEQGRVSQIQVQGMGLEGPLPSNFNRLTELFNIGLQRNKFSGPLPTFKGLSKLQKAYLGTNNFDTIPSDFFVDLTNLEILSLEYNNLNATEGWTLPADLKGSTSLKNLSLSQTNLVGSIPAFLGGLVSLEVLELAYNRLSGPIPSTFRGSQLVVFEVNNQDEENGQMLSGPIDVVGSMVYLRTLWMHGNKFNGTIPASLGNCSELQDLRLNDNQLVGPIPPTLDSLPLQVLSVDNNQLSGPIPDFKFKNYSYAENSFCQSKPALPCAPEVSALLDFLANVDYPTSLASSWTGNSPCESWIGIRCNADSKVSAINLPSRALNGTVSSSLANLTSLERISLAGNQLQGEVPTTLTQLNSLSFLDLSNNNISPPLPRFPSHVRVLYSGNPLLEGKSPSTAPSAEAPLNGKPLTPPTNSSGPARGSSSPVGSKSSDTKRHKPIHKRSSKKSGMVISIAIVSATAILLLLSIAVIFLCKKRKASCTVRTEAPGTVTAGGRDPSNHSDSLVKMLVSSQNGNGGSSISSTQSRTSSGPTDSQVIEAGNLIISVQVLKEATNNFSPENELGRGGFGAVYKGTLCNGTTIAVKRMEAAIVTTKGLNEFQSEIAVLSKVRHRNLVSLLGYCTEGNERLLVYEYMPQGALSRHLFEWAKNGIEPMTWKRRLNIALDVARGMEYLHGLAHRSFIHRDLKPSNILLGDDFHAKVSDFGLVKLAPEGKHSIETRLAGTFGYLAPEYAVTGRITTKADVYSFGVVLMELITGRRALDENEPEESMHLVSWFRRMYSGKETLSKAVDPVLQMTDETFESICTVAELSGHCTAREPYQRPDMGHAVNVLAPLVEKWKPSDTENDEEMGIDFEMSLPQALKKWQELEGTNSSRLDESKESIPTRPIGFAESFTSSDGR
eukprot:TRINITY_DN4771_c0_g1_i1.p1 TRINITY_DN4771_c0_g1~~TRINITY_DN4771_c0_g1_i1.p1  ORF type:complete len:972 (+),score=192.70 TRINITY_DN4771_c0_g1_i1:428-3343(+)